MNPGYNEQLVLSRAVRYNQVSLHYLYYQGQKRIRKCLIFFLSPTETYFVFELYFVILLIWFIYIYKLIEVRGINTSLMSQGLKNGEKF